MTITKSHGYSLVLMSALAVDVAGCVGRPGEIGEVGQTEGSGETEMASSTTMGVGPGPSSATGQQSEPCGEAGGPWCCALDEDRDGIASASDNAPRLHNPSQSDRDGDGSADGLDLCPGIAGQVPDAADSDNDGIGNACDLCPSTASSYNAGAPPSTPSYMRVRNIPTNADFDGDGIGDACDNCVATPNCAGPDCQSGAGMVGDACEGTTLPDAAGPVGLDPDDDFDQDGITNINDRCPRLPLAVDDRLACSAEQPCPGERSCEAGLCNHLDQDGDLVGDLCDTCVFSPNPSQVQDGGAQQDDPDGDFVGTICETHPDCSDVLTDPREIAFVPVSVSGQCCVQTWVVAEDGSGDILLADSCLGGAPYTSENCTQLIAPHPDDPLVSVVVRTSDTCPVGDATCSPLPISLGPWLPPGCEAALAAAGTDAVQNLLDRFDVVAATPEALYDFACLMPQRDQDHDGIGDACDLCPLAHDPTNAAYVNDEGTLFPDAGAACIGDFACQ